MHATVRSVIEMASERQQDVCILDTALGGSRVVDMLAGDPLPWIC